LRFVGDISTLAFDDRLVDLTDDAVDSFSSLFDPDALAWWTLLNEKSGQRKLYALPMGRTTNHLHVWKTLLEQAGFTLEDIPGSGMRSGHSGATRCSRPCAGRRGVTTSGA
jgi:hypothetical protein